MAPCPDRRISATAALNNQWFTEGPLPAPPETFPTFPAKSEKNKKPTRIVEKKANVFVSSCFGIKIY